MTIKANDYQERVIVFIDVLGFREHINRTVKEPAHFNKMKRVFNYISDYQKDNKKDENDQYDIGKEVTVFSDSIVISYPAELPGAVFSLLTDIVQMQLDMLTDGILFRGGITVGKLCHKDSIVFGPAMVEAYELESKVAVYPRVIVSNKTFEVAAQNPKNSREEDFEYIEGLVRKDFDEQYYIDFMSQWEEVDEISKYFGALTAIKVIIEKEIKANEFRPNVQVKYQWLKNYYNSTLDKIQVKHSENLYIE